MRKLNKDKRTQIIEALIEGCGVNATARICHVSKLTVLRLLSDLGDLCRDFHDLTVQGLTCQRVQLDEIWSFVGCKEKTRLSGGTGAGDAWVWVGIDADTKLVVSYMLGLRNSEYANIFVKDVARRLVNRVQLTSDRHLPYLTAVESAFGKNVDYAQLVKLYGTLLGQEVRYSQQECLSCRPTVITGKPDPAHISTSFVERQNLSMRMGMRRFTRLTNGFSKKWENHAHAIALYYFHYNFIRKHMTLGKTPAEAAGIIERAWTIADLVALLEKEETLRGNGGRINRADRT